MLVSVRVLLCQRFHLCFKVQHLPFYFFGGVCTVYVVRKHRLPFVGHRIVFYPNVAHTDKVARMVKCEIKETLFYQFVPVALHDSTFCH